LVHEKRKGRSLKARVKGEKGGGQPFLGVWKKRDDYGVRIPNKGKKKGFGRAREYVRSKGCIKRVHERNEKRPRAKAKPRKGRKRGGGGKKGLHEKTKGKCTSSTTAHLS